MDSIRFFVFMPFQRSTHILSVSFKSVDLGACIYLMCTSVAGRL